MEAKFVAYVRGQKYECIERKPHTTKDGREVELLVMESHCVDCKKKFAQTTTMSSLDNYNYLRRRCSACKNPRRAVEAKERKRRWLHQNTTLVSKVPLQRGSDPSRPSDECKGSQTAPDKNGISLITSPTGQKYANLGFRIVNDKYGVPVGLRAIKGRCLTCGQGFIQFANKLKVARFWLRKYCDECGQKGNASKQATAQPTRQATSDWD